METGATPRVAGSRRTDGALARLAAPDNGDKPPARAIAEAVFEAVAAGLAAATA